MLALSRKLHRAKLLFLYLYLILLASATTPAQTNPGELKNDLDSATEVLSSFMSGSHWAIPESVRSSALCVMVIPAAKKSAFITGANNGRGVVTCRSQRGWSAPSFVRVSGQSFGVQVGGSSADLVLLAMNREGIDKLLKGKFKLGADAVVLELAGL